MTYSLSVTIDCNVIWSPFTGENVEIIRIINVACKNFSLLCVWVSKLHGAFELARVTAGYSHNVYLAIVTGQSVTGRQKLKRAYKSLSSRNFDSCHDKTVSEIKFADCVQISRYAGM